MRAVFVLGIARSGTTWLQNMLGAHPEIATPQELSLFDAYVAPLQDAWGRQLPASEKQWNSQRYMGLPGVVDERGFMRLVTALLEQVYGEVLARKPGASIVLDKDPTNTLHAPLIHHYLPDAKFIHLIRDGRDVVASLLRASSNFGRGWAPNSAWRAAWLWRTYVVAGRRTAELTPNYLELRYEQLRSEDGPAALAEALAFCGAEASAETTRSIYDAFRLVPGGPEPPSTIVWGGEVGRRVGGSLREPEGFFGRGARGSWRSSLSRYEQWVVEHVSGELLEELGYVDPRWVPLGRVGRAAARTRFGLATLAYRTRFAAGAARLTFRERGKPPVPAVAAERRA